MGINILIIEDDEELLSLLKAAFKLNNFDSYIAKDIESAIKIANEEKIDVIFSDIVIGKDKVINYLDKLLVGKNKKAKIIFTTGYSDVAYELKNDIPLFIKPYDVDRIIEKIKKLID